MTSQELARNPWTQALVAELTGRNGGLLPGEELWHNRNVRRVHEFRALIADRERRGEIRRITDIVEKRHAAYVVVVRLKPPARRWPWYVSGVTLALGWFVTLALWMHAHPGQVVVISGAILLAVWSVSRIRHRGACSGLHCVGCR